MGVLVGPGGDETEPTGAAVVVLCIDRLEELEFEYQPPFPKPE